MNEFLAFAAAWLARLWPLSLIAMLTLGVVLLLRVPCRRLFGAERAFQLWLLVPLMLLLTAWPLVPRVGASSLPPVMVRIVTAPAALSVPVATKASRFDWRGVIVLGWAVGALGMLALAAAAQARFHKRLMGARRLSACRARWPVWQARDAGVGPALVGLWRPRIIVPADFHVRYGVTEQVLILAHEEMHARRGDVWLSLLAQLIACACWFLPFCGMALDRFRRDQELACDAAVLREHPNRRHSYAHAMLKTQPVRFALPLGCLWSSRHPVTERIAMLKQHPPRTLRRWSGLAALVGLSLGLGQVVLAAGSAGQHAATTSAEEPATAGTTTGYTLRVAVSTHDRPVQLRSTACYADGEAYALDDAAAGNLPPWHGRIAVVPAEHNMLEVRGDLSGGSLRKPVAPHIRMQPGQPGRIQVGEVFHGKDGRSIDRTLKLEITAWPGCLKPAENLVSDDVQIHFATNSARVVAQSIAQQAGLTIENPESLDNTRPVAGNFENVPAPEALRLIGNLVGMTPAFVGNRVRFAPN